MTIIYSKTGCDYCQKYWTHPFMDERDEIMITRCEPSNKRSSKLCQCSKCNAFWEYHPGSIPHGLTKEEAFEYFGFKNS